MMQSPKSQVPSSIQLYLIITVGVPGLGKSSLINSMRFALDAIDGTSVEVCVSDEVRSALLAREYTNRNMDLQTTTQEEIFKVEVECGPQVKSKLNSTITMKLMSLRNSGAKNCFFILDKNHCSGELVQFINKESEVIFKDCKIQRQLLMPNGFVSGQRDYFGPFVFDTIIIALIRSLHRKEHLTMKYGPLHSLLSFFTCLRSHASDDFEAKFPSSKFQHVIVDYYDAISAEKFKSKTSSQETVIKLKTLVMAVVDNSITIEHAAEFVPQLVDQLVPMSTFMEPTRERISAIVSLLSPKPTTL